jgi:hypothetical protein
MRSGARATNSAGASHIASRMRVLSSAPHGIWTKCLLRFAMSLICHDGQSISRVPT